LVFSWGLEENPLGLILCHFLHQCHPLLVHYGDHILKEKLVNKQSEIDKTEFSLWT